MTVAMQPLGPVMLDVAALRLDSGDRTRLLHPLTGGVILFKRNFESAAQLAELTAEIRALRSPELLIAVDHEGGRVQRFRTGYTTLPPMAALGALWNADRPAARRCAEAAGFVIATELTASGLDFSFTPVLDLDYSRSGVIGDRAFHRDAGAVSELASALITGLARGGVAAVGKHFPGHGYAAEDSHVAMPLDSRALADIEAADLVPYRRLSALLAAVMPAHVIYPQIDSAPAGFSSVWLQNILRRELGFDGMIFSDDLSMEGATVAGGIVERAQAALAAGCDMVLVCNQPQLADGLLAGLRWQPHDRWNDRVSRMRARSSYPSLNELHADPVYRTALAELQPVLTAAATGAT